MNEETKAVQTADDEWGDIEIDETDIVADKAEEQDAAPENDTADQQDAEGENAEAAETDTEAEREADQFTLKHLDEVRTVSREEIIPLAQKGMDYDRIRQKLDDLTAEKSRADQSLSILSELAGAAGFSDVNAFLDEVKAERLSKAEDMDMAAARSRVALERREKALADREAALNAEKQTAETARTEADRRNREALAFAGEYPDVKPTDIPPEVWEDVKKGETLVGAYRKYENAKLKAALAAKEKEAENRAKSAGSRQGDGPLTKQDEIDLIWNSTE